MSYPYEQIFAGDPSAPERVAVNGIVTIFEPGDATMAPLTITTLDGLPLANPIQVNESGFGPAFQHETLDQVAWAGGGFSGLMVSYKGLKDEAVAARLDASFAASEAVEARTAAEQAAHAAAAPTDESIDRAIEKINIPSVVSSAVADNAPFALAAEPSAVGDDTARLQALLTANAGATIALRPGRTYRITNPLELHSKTTLDLNGAVLDCRGMSAGAALGQRVAIVSSGTIGADIPITAPIAQWSRNIVGVSDVTGLAPEDLVLISNNEVPVPGSIGYGRLKGDLAVIQSVNAATKTVTLAGGVLFAYGTSGLKLRRIAPVDNVTIKNGRILMGGVGSAHNGVQIKFARNATVEDLTIDGAEDIAISFYATRGGKADHNVVTNSTSSKTLGNTGYGVAVLEGSRHVTVSGNQFYNCRHFIAGGGLWPPAFVDIVDNHGQRSSDAAYDCHESCFYWNFVDNTANGVGMGFIIRGQYCTVDGNKVIDSTSDAFRINAFGGCLEQRGIRVLNNEATRCASGVAMDGQGAGSEADCKKYDMEITGNTLRDCGANPIIVRNFDGMVIEGNHIYGSTSHAILCLGLATSQSQNLTISTGQVKNAGGDGVKVQYVDDVKTVGLKITSPAVHGLELLNCNRTDSVGLTVRNPGAIGLNISAGASHSVAAPFISGGAGAAYDAVRVAGSSDLSISGGTLAAGRYAIYSTTTENVTVSGVHMRGAGNGARFSIDATVKAITGNLV